MRSETREDRGILGSIANDLSRTEYNWNSSDSNFLCNLDKLFYNYYKYMSTIKGPSLEVSLIIS